MKTKSKISCEVPVAASSVLSGRLVTTVLAVMLALGSLPAQAQRFERRPPPRPNNGGQRRPGPHAGDWLKRYRNLPPAEQEKALRNDPEFRRLAPERQQRLVESLHHFSSLPVEQQNKMLDRMETWEHLTPEQQQNTQKLFQGIREMPPARRQLIVTTIHSLRQMDPEQRQQLMSSEKYLSNFSPAERQSLSEAMQLPFAPPSTEGETDGNDLP